MATPAVDPANPRRFEGVSLTNSWFGANWIEQGRPFDAETRETWITTYAGTRTKTVDRGRIRVNREGWMRIDAGADGARFAWIFDPVRSTSWLVDPTRNTVVSQGARYEPPSAQRPLNGASKPGMEVAENLGRRRIEGQMCQGYRHVVRGVGRPTGPVSVAGVQRDVTLGVEDFVVDTWTSLELGQVLREVRVSQHEFALLELHNLRLRPQDPALFRIPGERSGAIR
jgi:hypothetical protein